MTDTMLFGVLKMPFEMAMKDEISRIQFYARVQELVGRFEAQQQAEPVLQEIEQYRMQMAGISTAAIGYWKEGDGIHPDYDTLALRDVAKLYAKYDELYKAQPEQQAEPVAYDKTAMNCQCEACKNGNIHDSDCSVHNGDALPVGPCDCSLATLPVQPAESAESAQTFYQPAAAEAIKILKSLGYVYEPTYTGLAWVAKKSAQPEQQAEPVAWMSQAGNFLSLLEFTRADAELYGWKPVYTTPPQRPWVGLTVTTILDMMPSTIPAEYDGPLMEFARAVEAKLKERNGY